MIKKEVLKKITLVHSEKGGAGKSLAALLLADTLLSQHKKVIVIDADQSNADVYREFKGVITNVSIDTEKPVEVEVHQLDLGAQPGWWDLYNLMSKNLDEDTHIVVSLPSQIEFVMSDQKKEFKRALSDLSYKFQMVWLLTESMDSIQLLKLTVANNADILEKLVIALNGFFAEQEGGFVDFHNSKLKVELLTNPNYSVAYLPELNKRLKRALKTAKKPYSQALRSSELQYSERLGLECWLQEASSIFTTII